MKLWMKRISTSPSISRGILGLSLSLAANLAGCSTKLPESVIIPDSELLRPAIACKGWDVNSDLPPKDCTYDPMRVNIDLGYLRTLIDELDECRKARF